MEKTTTIYHIDGRQREMEVNEAVRLVGARQVGAGAGWSFHKPPPLDWERETPKYRATRDIQPAQNPRYRSEPPFAKVFDSDIWQYSERPIKSGELIETKFWPHPSFRPLNFSAGRVLDFFNARQKSRLPRSPWYIDHIRLDDGLSGPIIPDVRPPQMQPVDLRPVDLRPVS
jgi:hypothetical protein